VHRASQQLAKSARRENGSSHLIAAPDAFSLHACSLPEGLDNPSENCFQLSSRNNDMMFAILRSEVSIKSYHIFFAVK
jgi:hypothetical protein